MKLLPARSNVSKTKFCRKGWLGRLSCFIYNIRGNNKQ